MLTLVFRSTSKICPIRFGRLHQAYSISQVLSNKLSNGPEKKQLRIELYLHIRLPVDHTKRVGYHTRPLFQFVLQLGLQGGVDPVPQIESDHCGFGQISLEKILNVEVHKVRKFFVYGLVLASTGKAWIDLNSSGSGASTGGLNRNAAVSRTEIYQKIVVLKPG